MTPRATRSLPPSPHTPRPYDGPARDEVLAMRREYLTPGLITYYREPLLIVEGHMQYLWDETGKQYLDAFAGIVTVSVGHCHPKIVEKVREQVGTLQHTTTIYLHPTVGTVRQEAGRAHARRAAACRSATSPTPAARRTRSPILIGARVHRATARSSASATATTAARQAAMGADRRTAPGSSRRNPTVGRQARHARLLLPLPVRPDVSRAAT